MSYTAVPTKNPGDLLTSALWNTYLKGNADSGFMRMLGDTTLGANAATIAFSSIPATFAHLILIGSARGDTAAATVNGNLRFNGDSAANYLWELLDSTTTVVAGSSATAQTSLLLGTLPAATATASVFGPIFTIIPNYASATPLKDIISFAFYAGSPRVQLVGSHWASAAVINQLTLLPGVGNFVTGTRFTLYGVPS